MEGRIKFWNGDRFFGFIESEGLSLFFHGSQVASGADDLKVGDKVTFQQGRNDKGPMAVCVELLGAACLET